MSRTTHHRTQKTAHIGHDYGRKYQCNKGYNQSYGKVGRQRLHTELRMEAKRIIRNELTNDGTTR